MQSFQRPPQSAHSFPHRRPSEPLIIPISKEFFQCPGFPERDPWYLYGFGKPKTEIDKFHFDHVNDLILLKDPDFLFDSFGRTVGIPLMKKTKQWLRTQVDGRPKRGASCPPVMRRSGSRIANSTLFPISPNNSENRGRNRTNSCTCEIDSLDTFDWRTEERKAKEERRMWADYDLLFAFRFGNY